MAYIFIDFQYYTFVKKNVCNFLSCPLIQTRYIDIEMFSFIQSSRKPSYRGQNFSNSRLSSPFVKDFVFSNVTSEITIHKNLKFSVCWQPIRLLRRFISRKLFLTNILHEVTCKFICKFLRRLKKTKQDDMGKRKIGFILSKQTQKASGYKIQELA